MDTQPFDNAKNTQARQKLASDLAGLASESLSLSSKEIDMLSFMVEESLNGVNLENRYPDFYKKLFSNAALRQAFIDMLEMMDAAKTQLLAPLPLGAKPSLAFLKKQTIPLRRKITLQKSIQELQQLFSPPQQAYRAEANLFEDNWFTLLRDEIQLGNTTYSVILECGLSQETEDALAATLGIAMSLEAASTPGPSIIATLRWGKYRETITLTGEGRLHFPDVPLNATLEPEITSGLELVLELQPD